LKEEICCTYSKLVWAKFWRFFPQWLFDWILWCHLLFWLYHLLWCHYCSPNGKSPGYEHICKNNVVVINIYRKVNLKKIFW